MKMTDFKIFFFNLGKSKIKKLIIHYEMHKFTICEKYSNAHYWTKIWYLIYIIVVFNNKCLI